MIPAERQALANAAETLRGWPEVERVIVNTPAQAFDDLRASLGDDAALNSTELDAEFASATPVRTSGLNFYWPCTDTSNTNDSSGNGRNPTISGTIVNGATLFSGGGSAIAAIASYYNRLRASA